MQAATADTRGWGNRIVNLAYDTHDRRRQRTKIGVIAQDAVPSYIGAADQFWLGDFSLESQVDDAWEDRINVGIAKPPRNANSDRPLQTWTSYKAEYLDESLRCEGRGSAKTYAKCAGSQCLAHQCLERECEGPAEWRCVDQACFGELMYCRRCIVAAHAQHPTHFVERWNGRNFERDRRWLQKLGLCVQLGHPLGVICTSRKAAAIDFVLYNVTGVHKINVDFCGCRPKNDASLPEVERRVPAVVGLLVAHHSNCAKHLRDVPHATTFPDAQLSGKVVSVRFLARSGEVYQS
ncbi:CxC2 domain-containing protein [Mycena venus]|uniref:CxC2 domain-containing protein n=1 Tax=Mycena venus TaxID=2733690 RepID=A0A8H6YIA9_9AGAR|nr:CxC2 domain-containing protein [Mycena venus]